MSTDHPGHSSRSGHANTSQTPAPSVHTVVFDLGGVLIDWNPRYLYRKLFADDEERMEFFLREICTHSWNEQQDAGHPFAEAIAELSARHPEWVPMIRLYFERWPEMLAGAIEGTVEILRSLKKSGTPLFALTNWSAETFPFALERFEFLQWFDGILVSGTEKMKKPDPRIFQLLSQRFNLDAPSCLFIDDVQHNLEGAASVGFQTHLFRNPDSLREDLIGKRLL